MCKLLKNHPKVTVNLSELSYSEENLATYLLLYFVANSLYYCGFQSVAFKHKTT